MQALLAHAHWIPWQRGYLRQHLLDHFPGWEWNDLLEICRAAEIIDPRSGRGAPLRCLRSVRAFHFTSRDAWAVEWTDGTLTVPRESSVNLPNVSAGREDSRLF